MKRETEDPTRHFQMSAPLISESGKLDNGIAVEFVVLPLDLRPVGVYPMTLLAGRIEHIMYHAEMVVRWRALKVCLEWEDSSVPSGHILQNTRFWIHGREVGQRAKATQGRCSCELFYPLSDHHFAIVDRYSSCENIEASWNERRVEVGQCCYCRK